MSDATLWTGRQSLAIDCIQFGNHDILQVKKILLRISSGSEGIVWGLLEPCDQYLRVSLWWGSPNGVEDHVMLGMEPG